MVIDEEYLMKKFQFSINRGRVSYEFDETRKCMFPKKIPEKYFFFPKIITRQIIYYKFCACDCGVIFLFKVLFLIFLIYIIK